jgi:hypothetical protein
MSVADAVAGGKRVGQVLLEFTAKNLTGFAGLVAFHEFVQRLGVERLLDERLTLRHIGTRYGNGRLLLAMIYGLVVGLERLQDTALLRFDSVLLKALGWAAFPVQSTLSRFLRKFTGRAVDTLEKAGVELLDRFRGGWKGFSTIHLDLDSHVRTVYGRTLEGAARGYNPNKRGRPSYHPLVAFIGETRDFLCARFRPGNTTISMSVAFLRKCMRYLRPSRFKLVVVRADSGFCFLEFLQALERFSNVAYIIALKLYPHHQARFGGLVYRPVEGSSSEEGLECSEYQSSDWGDGKKRRVIVIRQVVPDKDSGREVRGKQLKLFDLQGYAYRAFVTTSTATIEEAWRDYNGRGCCENHIKEGINLGLDINASRRYQANAAHLLTVMLTYNLLNWFKEVGLGQQEEKTMGKWVQERLLWIPAVLVHSARQLRLKLPQDWPWRALFEQAVARLLGWGPAPAQT